jgi:hypothetical protein
MSHRPITNKSLSGKSKAHNRGDKSGRRREKDLILTLIRAYPGQIVWESWIPGAPVKLTTVVATGVISLSLAVSPANIDGFAARFSNTFQEYRIVRAKVTIRMFSSTNPGIIQFWWDENDVAAPSVTDAVQRFTQSVNASATSMNEVMQWSASDPKDLQYVQTTGTFPVPVSFKAYTNNANFASSIVASDYFEVIPEFQFQFRGLI